MQCSLFDENDAGISEIERALRETAEPMLALAPNAIDFEAFNQGWCSHRIADIWIDGSNRRRVQSSAIMAIYADYLRSYAIV